jgi:hypothetical protein
MSDEEVVDSFWAGNCSECGRPPRDALVIGRCEECSDLQPYEVKAPDRPPQAGDRSDLAAVNKLRYPPTGNPRLWALYGAEGPPE